MYADLFKHFTQGCYALIKDKNSESPKCLSQRVSPLASTLIKTVDRLRPSPMQVFGAISIKRE